jgi:ubiquinone/menaquinone biosynthesis C-methylase UbiE
MLERFRDRWYDRVTDRMARKPAGRRARRTYGASDVHSFAWDPVLSALGLEPDDALLDVGCGGGIFLRRALETGCQAAGVDHSGQMVRLARRNNSQAVREGRLRIVEGTVEDLPFDNGEFTALSCIVAFIFFADPVQALKEMRRVLHRGNGRLAVFTTPPELAGTPAAPHPLAARSFFYSDDELRELPGRAGFAEAEVTRTDIGAQLLTARG